MVFCDVDHFKRINDTLGHAAGDTVLEELAERFSHLIRGSDFVSRPASLGPKPLVSRVGGDEFVLLVSALRKPEDAVLIAKRIQEAVVRPLEVSGHTLSITASLGIAIWPGDGEDAESLLRNADAALHHAKSKGRDSYRFYDASMNRIAVEQLGLESELRVALERDELVVHYQPTFEVGTGRLMGAEALVRWQHPERGLIAPIEFLPTAERSRLINLVGERVMREACRAQRQWAASGVGRIRVGVNLSTRQLCEADFAENLCRLVNEYDITPDISSWRSRRLPSCRTRRPPGSR